MARLNTTIHVYDEGETIVYLPGQEVLPQHRAQITAPGVWEDEPDTADTVSVDESPIVIPPKSGRGSKSAAWIEYAAKATAKRGLRIDIPDDAGRDDIIDALEAAGIPTE